MHPENQQSLEQRVIRSAEAALAHQQYVGAVDVLCNMGLLAPTHLESWRKGRVEFLEEVIQGSPRKIAASLALFHQWARDRGLRPTEARYTRTTRGESVDLRFSPSGNPEIEKYYRTHYLSPLLSAKKQQRLTEKMDRPDKPVVFQIVRDSECSECGAELEKGSFLFMDAGQPLCLACARLGDLEYLPSGDAALTRRATKYSQRSAVVVRFSRSRGRYERQGILVEVPAVERAEQECALDAGERAAERVRNVAARLKQDRELVARMTDQILKLYPGCPAREAAAIAEHTAVRGSGRVGRTAAGRNLDAAALTAAVTAAVRHRHTAYDRLLDSGLDRQLARERVSDQVRDILAEWRQVSALP